MLNRIVAFFMAIIAFFSSLFGIGGSKDRSFELMKDVKYGSYDRNYVDIAIPEGSDGNIPLILDIHGGAWVSGDKGTYKNEITSIAKEYGCVGAAMNYRYLSENTTMFDILNDITACLSCIKRTLAEKGITVDKCILTGMSAGAHLSLLYAYSKKQVAPVEPVAVVSFCGPTDFVDGSFFNSDIGGEDVILYLLSAAIGMKVTSRDMSNDPAIKEKLSEISPIHFVDTAVPTVIAHGKKDTTVPYSNAVELDALLTEKGIRHDFVTYPNSNHSLSSDPECGNEVFNLFVQYVNEYMR